ncbi:hypothetical protein HPB48_017644 [Haemaphysalis longicornis]|uniref:Uncharacterized protein n=1 Tax=Haemaphysalis longicornis TaxID=44386 RepID=A0A9J6FM83_HAELO|nr:hypothetical protein HPB48_017644 [Haemaphysalis longicornis]
MDIHIRYWDASHKVATRYFTSVFMGHSKAENIEEKLLSALEPLPLEIVQFCEFEGFQAFTRTPAAELSSSMVR